MLPVWGAYVWRGLYMQRLIFGISGNFNPSSSASSSWFIGIYICLCAYFYVSLNLVAVTTVRILLKFMI